MTSIKAVGLRGLHRCDGSHPLLLELGLDVTVIRPKTLPNKAVARIELEGGVSVAVLEPMLPLLIGRSHSCGLSIPTSHVSRRHCELFMQDGALCLRDLSANGTTVGNKHLRKETSCIDGRTTITLAGDISITVTPEEGVQERRSQRTDRRQSERRQGERRCNVVTVDFERRHTDERRSGNRRVGSRRAAAG